MSLKRFKSLFFALFVIGLSNQNCFAPSGDQPKNSIEQAESPQVDDSSKLSGSGQSSAGGEAKQFWGAFKKFSSEKTVQAKKMLGKTGTYTSDKAGKAWSWLGLKSAWAKEKTKSLGQSAQSKGRAAKKWFDKNSPVAKQKALSSLNSGRKWTSEKAKFLWLLTAQKRAAAGQKLASTRAWAGAKYGQTKESWDGLETDEKAGYAMLAATGVLLSGVGLGSFGLWLKERKKTNLPKLPVLSGRARAASLPAGRLTAEIVPADTNFVPTRPSRRSRCASLGSTPFNLQLPVPSENPIIHHVVELSDESGSKPSEEEVIDPSTIQAIPVNPSCGHPGERSVLFPTTIVPPLPSFAGQPSASPAVVPVSTPQSSVLFPPLPEAANPSSSLIPVPQPALPSSPSLDPVLSSPDLSLVPHGEGQDDLVITGEQLKALASCFPRATLKLPKEAANKLNFVANRQVGSTEFVISQNTLKSIFQINPWLNNAIKFGANRMLPQSSTSSVSVVPINKPKLPSVLPISRVDVFASLPGNPSLWPDFKRPMPMPRRGASLIKPRTLGGFIQRKNKARFEPSGVAPTLTRDEVDGIVPMPSPVPSDGNGSIAIEMRVNSQEEQNFRPYGFEWSSLVPETLTSGLSGITSKVGKFLSFWQQKTEPQRSTTEDVISKIESSASNEPQKNLPPAMHRSPSGNNMAELTEIRNTEQIARASSKNSAEPFSSLVSSPEPEIPVFGNQPKLLNAGAQQEFAFVKFGKKTIDVPVFYSHSQIPSDIEDGKLVIIKLHLRKPCLFKIEKRGQNKNLLDFIPVEREGWQDLGHYLNINIADTRQRIPVLDEKDFDRVQPADQESNLLIRKENTEVPTFRLFQVTRVNEYDTESSEIDTKQWDFATQNCGLLDFTGGGQEGTAIVFDRSNFVSLDPKWLEEGSAFVMLRQPSKAVDDEFDYELFFVEKSKDGQAPVWTQIETWDFINQSNSVANPPALEHIVSTNLLNSLENLPALPHSQSSSMGPQFPEISQVPEADKSLANPSQILPLSPALSPQDLTVAEPKASSRWSSWMQSFGGITVVRNRLSNAFLSLRKENLNVDSSQSEPSQTPKSEIRRISPKSGSV